MKLQPDKPIINWALSFSLQRAMFMQEHKHPPYSIVSLSQPDQGCGIRAAIETGPVKHAIFA
jgi:hypothetical protein